MIKLIIIRISAGFRPFCPGCVIRIPKAFQFRRTGGTDMKKRNRLILTAKNFLIAILIITAVFMSVSCGRNTARLEIDQPSGTFNFIDSSGNKIPYDTLLLNGKEVIDYQCTSIMGTDSVMLATEKGQIVRDGNTTTYNGKGFTEASEFSYTLKYGVLNVKAK